MKDSDDEILSLVTFGGLLIFLATIFLITHLLFLAVNLKKCGFESNFAYTLMCLISILDCIQLLIHCITGVIVCFKVRMPLMKVIGAFMESSWILMGISTVFLSFHRFIFTALSEKAEKTGDKYFEELVDASSLFRRCFSTSSQSKMIERRRLIAGQLPLDSDDPENLSSPIIAPGHSPESLVTTL
ncbi:unnamed protein product [Haemonchus placei]|uniref:G_PROTEIN_RECEP_F1_2 domain-containing protein n=1 Tax=Haemonchus placei TaxID=6290 RepID=A0A158QMR8_HAEPC|nr:unnamed protein product [Haemonchus placei]